MSKEPKPGWFGRDATFVVEHAKWRMSQGSYPSKPYKGERNPRKAYKLARSELKFYVPREGTHIEDFVVRLVENAKLLRSEVAGTNNGILVFANGKSDPKVLRKAWETLARLTSEPPIRKAA